MWACDFDGCSRRAVRGQGDCVICDRHICSTHMSANVHHCPKWEDEHAYDPARARAGRQEIDMLIQSIDIEALAARASALRGGLACTICRPCSDSHDQTSFMGGMNIHLEIQFSDSVVWLARVRRCNATSPPVEIQNHILRSEVATLNFLQTTSVPAPKVFDFQLQHEGGQGRVGFILMEKMPGRPLKWSTATPAERETVMRQLVGFFIELHRRPFDRIGSLAMSPNLSIEPLAQESFFGFTGSGTQPLGPFSSLGAYHTAYLRLVLDQIVRDELYALQPVDAYLIHSFLLDLVPKVLSDSAGDGQESFYLKHADDKGDHILVDEDFNITAIIDWEWARTMPPALAFNSPIAMLPVAAFYEGSNELGEDEAVFVKLLHAAGRSDLARCVETGRLQHRFAFCCGYDLCDWRGFLGLFAGLRRAVGVDAGLGWDAWKKVALDRYGADVRLQSLLSRVAVANEGR